MNMLMLLGHVPPYGSTYKGRAVPGMAAQDDAEDERREREAKEARHNQVVTFLREQGPTMTKEIAVELGCKLKDAQKTMTELLDDDKVGRRYFSRTVLWWAK